MTTNKILGALLITALLALTVVWYVNKTPQVPNQQEVATKPVAQPSPQAVKVSSYVLQNISDLSPVKATEGMSFTIRSIQILVSSATGIVEYGDGIKTYKADLEYSFDSSDNVSIKSFKIQK